MPLQADDPLPIAFVQTPASDAQPVGGDTGNSILADRYLGGMRIVTARLDGVDTSRRVVSDGFTCATDPVFSHDGTRLAFSGRKRADDRLAIWELVRDDPAPQQIGDCDGDAVSPVFLPTGGVIFASTLSREFEEHGRKLSFSLQVLPRGQRDPVRLTFNPSSEFDPIVLPDGRILYSSWQHVGNHHWPRGTVSLMLVNSDGTGVFPLTGGHRGPWLKRGACYIGDDRIAFIRADKYGDFGAGELVTTSLNDAFAPYRVLLPINRFEVSDLALLPDGDLLLAARPTDGSTPTFGLYRFHDGEITPVYDDPAMHELAPAVGGVRPRPDLRFSTVVEDTPYGYLAILNCEETDRTDQHPLRKGSVKAVRVLQGLPLRHKDGTAPAFVSVATREGEPAAHPASGTGGVPVRILGEVPPASDGSVYLKVPADRPLRIQLIDRDGFSIVNERAWFWVRPHERRVCIGCHENRELSPNNVAPLAVRREPTDLTDPAGWRSVTFREDIQPILETSCALSACHIPPTPTAAMNLSPVPMPDETDAPHADLYGPAYANLLARQDGKPFAVGGRRVHPGDARRSPLLWMLYGRALAPQYKPAVFERPMMDAHPGPMLPEAQLELFRKWVDLGALYSVEAPVGPWPYTFEPPDSVVMEGKSDATK